MQSRSRPALQRLISDRLALALTILGIIGRLAPHPPNFTPVGSSALFAGARLKGWRAYAVPLVAMAVSAPLLPLLFGLAAFPRITPFVYGSLLVNVAIGGWLAGRSGAGARGHVRLVATGALLCSLQFFVVTNFGVWLLGSLYAHSVAGLTACYAAALPFYARTLAGDVFYAGALFGLHAWVTRLAARHRRPADQAGEPAAAR